MSPEPRVLLILPCTNIKPYSRSPTWHYILERLKPWHEAIDFVAIDCITNPQTGKPFGIVPMSEEDMVVGLDEKPDLKKLPSLIEEVRSKLCELRSDYLRTIAYINVRAYWEALAQVAEEFEITLLPSVYRNAKSWSVEAIGASPLGVFRKYANELVQELEKEVTIVDRRRLGPEVMQSTGRRSP